MVVLEWVMAGVAQARREGLIVASPGWESTVLQKLCDLRASMMQLPDELSARIPLAYVHLTSLLVDALLTLSPLALLPRTGAFTVVLCPLIVRSYPYRFNINTQLHPLHSLRPPHFLPPPTPLTSSAHAAHAADSTYSMTLLLP